MSRKLSEAGIKLIKKYEGCRLTAYKPVPTEKYWTIGWGHYGKDVTSGMTITQAKADSMLVTDLVEYEVYVNSSAYVPVTAQLNQNQFDALVSFCYNCGAGNLQTLCKGRTIEQIAENITKYDKSSGTVLAGLTKRRKEEQELFKTITAEAKEDDTLELTKYQWDTLETKVKALLNAGTISDKTWLTKITEKTLTNSELSWLSFILAAR